MKNVKEDKHWTNLGGGFYGYHCRPDGKNPYLRISHPETGSHWRAYRRHWIAPAAGGAAYEVRDERDWRVGKARRMSDMIELLGEAVADMRALWAAEPPLHTSAKEINHKPKKGDLS